MDTCALASGRPAPRVGLTNRDRPMVWHKNRFWGKKLIKNLFFPLVEEKAKTSNSPPLLVPREPSELLLAAAGLLRRHPLAAPFQGASMQRTRALGYYFEDIKSLGKAVLSFPENLTFRKTMVATRADNPKCVSAHDAFETDRTPVPLTSLCVCCALHGCAVDGIFLGTFVVERWTLPRRGHQLPHLPRGPLFSGVRPRAAWHGRSDPARRARGITPGTSHAIAPGDDACALVGADVTCALRALARGTQETRVVGCWKCWCLFCTSNCRNADSSRIAPPFPQVGPTLAALPAQQ